MRHRVLAYRRAAARVRSTPVSVAEMALAGRATDLPDIGATLQSKIVELARTGTIAALDAIRERVPEGLAAIAGLEGIGPKRAVALWRDLGVTDLDQLAAGRGRRSPGRRLRLRPGDPRPSRRAARSAGGPRRRPRRADPARPRAAPRRGGRRRPAGRRAGRARRGRRQPAPRPRVGARHRHRRRHRPARRAAGRPGRPPGRRARPRAGRCGHRRRHARRGADRDGHRPPRVVRQPPAARHRLGRPQRPPARACGASRPVGVAARHRGARGDDDRSRRGGRLRGPRAGADPTGAARGRRGDRGRRERPAGAAWSPCRTSAASSTPTRPGATAPSGSPRWSRRPAPSATATSPSATTRAASRWRAASTPTGYGASGRRSTRRTHAAATSPC